jgi:deoxycytidylate deaminase
MINLKELFEAVATESTCQKRPVVCILVSKEGRVVSSGANRCEPEGGLCARLNINQNKENYDTTSTCNWSHAEIQAIANLPEGYKPHFAILKGHQFFCQPCEDALKAVGVTEFEIIEE